MKKFIVKIILISLIFNSCDEAGKTNEIPQIDDLSGSTVRMNENTTSTALEFQIRDSETIEGSLILKAFSANQTLISNSGIVISGTNREREVRLTPNTNQFGTTDITIRVFDADEDSVETTFTLIVEDKKPGISVVSSKSILENSSNNQITISISASEIPTSQMAISAISDNSNIVASGNMTYSGSGNNRILTITPIEDTNGTLDITITVSEPNDDSESTTLTLTVTDYGFSIDEGVADFAAGNYSSALSHFNDAISIEDVNSVAFTWLGWTNFKLTNLTESIEAFESAISINSGRTVDTYAGYAFALNANKDYDESNSSSATAINMDDEWAFDHGISLTIDHIYILRAQNFFNLGDYEDSLGEVNMVDESFSADVNTPEGLAELAAKIEELLSSD